MVDDHPHNPDERTFSHRHGRAHRGMSVRWWISIAILMTMLEDAELDAIEGRCQAASPGPWTAFVEERDHGGGDDFIRVSDRDDEPDMYVSRADADGIRPASTADLDFIAAARQDLPALLAEVRRQRSEGP